jgi:predicted Zn-dependent peptidase
MRALMLMVVTLAGPALSQDLPHPDDLDLPGSDYVRPDPAGYRHELDNGLVAYVAEADEVPLVTLSAFVRAGLASDERQGAAEALREALRTSGPADTGDAEFARQLDRMAADFTVAMHDEWTEISINVPVEDFDAASRLFAGLLRDPGVGRDAIRRAGGAAGPESADLGGESGAALYAGSMDVAVGHFYDTIYKEHPYGARPSAADFGRLKARDVRQFHATFFVPGNTTLAIAGAIDPGAVKERVDELFADWPAASVPEVVRQPSVERNERAMHHYPSNKLQSWMVIGHDLPPVPLDEQAALDVMTYIVGEYHLNTRLMRETRYKYGYTNDASAFLEDRWLGPGGYSFRSYSRPEVIEDIYRNMMRELERVREEPVSDRELEVAQGALTDGLFQERYDGGYALTRSFALEKLRYGDHDRSATYVDRVRDVSKEDVLDAARKYLHPENMQVILIGESAFDVR